MQRRNFIKSLAIGAAGLSTSSLWASPSASKKLGIQLYTVRDAVAKDLPGTLERLAKLGYNKLEIYGYNGTFFGKSVSEFKSILSGTGMQVRSSHHLPGHAMKMKGTLLDGWDKAVEDMHAIGAKYMACAYLFPEERTGEFYAKLPDLLNKSGEKTKSAGIQFAYHNHDFEFEKYNDSLLYEYLLKNTDPAMMNMEMDLYWAVKAKQDPVSWFERYPGRFPLWHVKDLEKGSEDITEVGNGSIDFDRIFAARKKAGMKEWFVEQDESKGDIFKSIEQSHRYLDTKKFA
ncbi:sugar phosphate isomerase/epimerase [Chitinophaga caseinilytica]|uniref:Sugar phosphate isomerase/epimerase n=1 Tax=Chitinophaga caseinilytica TaxID=2267521 RepID=A0ABZ2Z2N0_9BACT